MFDTHGTECTHQVITIAHKQHRFLYIQHISAQPFAHSSPECIAFHTVHREGNHVEIFLHVYMILNSVTF